MACHLVGVMPLSEAMLGYYQLTLRHKLQWNINRNSYIFIQQNTLENIVCEMSAILSRPQCVKTFPHSLNARTPAISSLQSVDQTELGTRTATREMAYNVEAGSRYREKIKLIVSQSLQTHRNPVNAYFCWQNVICRVGNGRSRKHIKCKAVDYLPWSSITS